MAAPSRAAQTGSSWARGYQSSSTASLSERLAPRCFEKKILVVSCPLAESEPMDVIMALGPSAKNLDIF